LVCGDELGAFEVLLDADDGDGGGLDFYVFVGEEDGECWVVGCSGVIACPGEGVGGFGDPPNVRTRAEDLELCSRRGDKGSGESEAREDHFEG